MTFFFNLIFVALITKYFIFQGVDFRQQPAHLSAVPFAGASRQEQLEKSEEVEPERAQDRLPPLRLLRRRAPPRVDRPQHGLPQLGSPASLQIAHQAEGLFLTSVKYKG